MRLDSRSTFPSGMGDYLEFYGWHFSKKMEEWAASKMYKEVNGQKQYITPYTKESLEELLNKVGISLDGDVTYDTVYIANMAKADFFGSSIPDEAHLVKYVKDVCEDPDAYEGMPFTRFYADCIGSGCGINWEDMI